MRFVSHTSFRAMRVLEESTAKFSLQRISARLKGLVQRRHTATISRSPQLRRTTQQQGVTTEQQGVVTQDLRGEPGIEMADS